MLPLCTAHPGKQPGKVLDTLQPKYKLVLVSNFYGNIETILKDFRLEYFEQIVESAVVGVRKPTRPSTASAWKLRAILPDKWP